MLLVNVKFGLLLGSVQLRIFRRQSAVLSFVLVLALQLSMPG